MMWVSELLQSLIIEDDARVTIQIGGTSVASGNWYQDQDQILDYSEHNVRSFAVDYEKNRVLIRVDGELEL